MNRIVVAALGSLALASALVAVEGPADTIKRLSEANDVVTDMTKISDKGIPEDLIRKAQCIVVIPGLKKGGFIIGAKYGKGFISCRHPSDAGWTSPAAVRIGGGSVGFQAGATEVDVILLVMNREGAKKLLESQFTLGADATLSGGPVGRSSAAQTDAKLTAGILSYSRSRGIFAGFAVDAGTLRQDKDENTNIYGSKLSNKEIMTGNQPIPAAAQPLISALNKLSYSKQ
jgi:SH3 domain-containing YSC84-like protein 1